MIILAWVLGFVGGAIGSVCRFWLSGAVAERFGETFPYGTLAVNAVGSVVIGLAAGWLAHHGDAFWAPGVRVFMIIGFCGGLTTFSSFGLQTWNLVLSGRWLSALANVLGSTALCLGAVAFGWSWAQGLP
ncbi:MAG: fluoride efflux transporter CrcB [Verrucomicrobia bacterium]|nr:fluoride efflux transporter CrcB [Verrucomicrobiota bacterium]